MNGFLVYRQSQKPLDLEGLKRLLEGCLKVSFLKETPEGLDLRFGTPEYNFDVWVDAKFFSLHDHCTPESFGFLDLIRNLHDDLRVFDPGGIGPVKIQNIKSWEDWLNVVALPAEEF